MRQDNHLRVKTLIVTPDGAALDVCWCDECQELRDLSTEPGDPTKWEWEQWWERRGCGSQERYEDYLASAECDDVLQI